MDINFTGLKNIYGLKMNEIPRFIPDKPTSIYGMDEHLFLNVHLKDDLAGRDLTEFRTAIATTDCPGKRHPINSEFINISTLKNSKISAMGEQNTYKFFINGKPMNVNRQNMKFFTYLAKLLKKIQEIPEKKLVVNEDFKNGEDVYTSLILGDRVQTDYSKYIPKMFSHDNITLRAKELMSNLQEAMEEYLKV